MSERAVLYAHVLVQGSPAHTSLVLGPLRADLGGPGLLSQAAFDFGVKGSLCQGRPRGQGGRHPGPAGDT